MMSDWEDLCGTLQIDPQDPDGLEDLLDRESREERVRSLGDGLLGLRARLKVHADPSCLRCGGEGYLGRYKDIERGRCFLCLPDSTWESVVQGV